MIEKGERSPVDAPVDDGWRDSFGTLAAWRRHAVWLIAAALTGGVALGFEQVNLLGNSFIAAAREWSPLLPAAVLVVAMIAITALRDRVFPGTEGTGIPQVIAALSLPAGPARDSVLSLRIAAGKILLLSLGLLSGMTIGREGPSVHVGAALLHLSTRYATFPRYLAERGLVLAGGAAGIAAAFNAPVAGIVFAIEEIARSFEKRSTGALLRTVLVATLVPVAVLGVQVFYGRMQAQIALPAGWIAVVLLGVAGGLLGGGFARALLALLPHWSRLTRSHPWLAPGALGLLLGALAFASGGLSQSGGFEQTRAMLQAGEVQPLWFAPVRALASFVCLLSGIPGGLFDPSLTVGAGLGQLATAFFPSVEPRAIVLLAMVSYFSGVVQSPITAGVILLEMTRAGEMTLPLLVAAVIAYEASRRICPTALYEGLAQGFLGRLGRG